MKNWEMYESEIKKIGEIDFGYVDGMVLPCDDIPSCVGCGFEPPDNYSCDILGCCGYMMKPHQH